MVKLHWYFWQNKIVLVSLLTIGDRTKFFWGVVLGGGGMLI